MSLPDFERVLRTFEQTKPALARWYPKTEELGSRLHDKATAMRPSIIVYGIYNAGKSTLLNALMGKSEATMSDRPETAKITSYLWQGYTLLDTPGIDAPAWHEELARAELDKCDVVLFVVAMGGAIDEKKTWEELVEIVRRGRRVMLIVNNKQGLEPGSHEFSQIEDKLRSNLQQIAQENDVANVIQQVPIRLVNARSALNGRLQNKPPLVEHSGILELERALTEFLRQCDSQTVFDTCRRDLLSAVEMAERTLQAKTGNAKSQALTQSRQSIDDERDRLDCALNDEVERLLLAEQRKMSSIIQQLAQGSDSAAAQSKMAAAASEVATSVGNKLNTIAQGELKTTQQNLRDIGNVLSNKLVMVDASVHVPLGESPEVGGESVVGKAIKEAVPKIPIGDLAEKGTLAALKIGKEQFSELFKGVGAKTMGKWAGAVGKWAGPVIQAGLFLWEMYQAHSAAEAQRLSLERQAQAIEDAVSDYMSNLRDGYRTAIAELGDQVFKPLEDWLRKTEADARGQTDEVEADRSSFAQAYAALR